MDRYDLDEQNAVRDHDAIMAATRSPRIDPPLVYKTIEDARSVDLAASRQIGDDLSPPLDDDLMEQLAEVLAQVRIDMRTEFEDALDLAAAPLRERIAVLECQLSLLMVLLGGDSGRTLEASETVRKLRMAK
jgi:hypothetical protein